MKLIGPFAQVLTMTGLAGRGALSDSNLQVIPNGGVLTDTHHILEAGSFSELKQRWPQAKIEARDGRETLLPGFIDAHTHICWSGSRAGDFALRNSGHSYLEIAGRGGGIWSTVNHTRLEEDDILVANLKERALRHLREGVTTIEVKSGYGLTVEAELRQLRAIREASKQDNGPRLVPTCLAAHTKPRDFEGSHQEYLKLLIYELLPQIIHEHLAGRVDIFVEQTAFDVEQARFYLRAASELGFDVTVHADQFTIGGSGVAVDCGAVSADHLEASGREEIERLASSDTVAVALPGASLGLGMPFAPARRLLDAGAVLAIASDWNPGSAPMGQLLTQAAILATYEKLSNAEVLAGLTIRAAKALRISNAGEIARGFAADLVAWPTSDYRDILYNMGQMRPCQVWKSSTICF
jgi:imidazolonepropionase